MRCWRRERTWAAAWLDRSHTRGYYRDQSQVLVRRSLRRYARLLHSDGCCRRGEWTNQPGECARVAGSFEGIHALPRRGRDLREDHALHGKWKVRFRSEEHTSEL